MATNNAVNDTSEGLTITNALKMDNTTSSVLGVLMTTSAGSPMRWVHNYGTSNTFIGPNTGNFTLTGTESVAVGRAALFALTSGTKNTCFGLSAGDSFTTGGSNTAFGASNNDVASTGSRNCTFGVGTGSSITTSSDSFYICHDWNGSNTGRECAILSNNSTGGSKAFVGGIRGVTTDINDAINVLVSSTNNILGTTTSSERYKENIEDLPLNWKQLYHLRPVIFNYKKSPQVQSFGLIAEEVEAIYPQLCRYGTDGHEAFYEELPEQYRSLSTEELNDQFPQLVVETQQKMQQRLETVAYNQLTILLLKAVQDLRVRLDAVKARNGNK